VYIRTGGGIDGETATDYVRANASQRRARGRNVAALRQAA